MRKESLWCLCLSGLFLLLVLNLQAENANLLVNPSLKDRYAAQKVPKLKFPENHTRKNNKTLPGYVGEQSLPYGWSVIPKKDGQGKLSWDKNSFRIQAANGETLWIKQRYIEIVPDLEYAATLNFSGQGKIRIRVSAATPGPGKVYVDKTFNAAADPKSEKIVFKAEPHRRMAEFVLIFTGPCDIRVLESGLWTELPEVPVKAGAKIAGSDVNTIFYESFDLPLKNATGNPCEVVEGRYGKGINVSPKKGGTVIPLSGFDLPEEGTVEFWYKPESFPVDVWDNVALKMTTQTPGLSNTEVQVGLHHYRGSIGSSFKKSMFKRGGASGSDLGTGWGWWKPGTWHHLAGVWDKEGMRIYVDGVLEGVNYKSDLVLPRGKAVDLRFLGPGVIDDVRISKGNRFRYKLPEKVKYGSWNPPKAKKDKSATAKVAKVTEEELVKARKSLISPIPKLNADYVFGVGKAKASWDAMKGMKLEKDFYGPSHDRMTFISKTGGTSAFWKLEGIKPGEYHVGLWVESQQLSRSFKSEYATENLLAMAYLNGMPLRFATSSDPVQVKPGIWLCELLSKEPVELKDGDEIAFAGTKKMLGGKRPFFRLALYKDKPVTGHGVTGQAWGLEHGVLQRLRVLLLPSFSGSAGDGEEQEAKLTIVNPLPCEIDVDVKWKMTDYFGAPLWNGNERVKLAPHKTKVFTHKFTAKGKDEAYLMEAKSTPAPGYKHPFVRKPEMMEMDDYTMVEFLPDLGGPLEAWNQARMKLKTVKSGDRRRISLDGKGWEHAWMSNRRLPEKVPADLKFTKAKIPYGRWSNPRLSVLPKDKFGSWNRRKFVLPKGMKNRRILINLGSSTETQATVFLNGKRFESLVPTLIGGQVDVTSAIKTEGENDLVICVRGPIALMREDFIDKYDSENRTLIKENQELACPKMHALYIQLGRVGVLSEPKVGVRQALVLSDPANNKIKAMLRVSNSTPEKRKVDISFKVEQNGTETKATIPALSIELAPWESKEVSSIGAGENLLPWAPGSPNLAKLIVNVKSGDNKVLDDFSQRFGYRKYRVNGLQMDFNGRRAMFMGTSRYPSKCFLEKEGDIILERIAKKPERLDELDELGRLNYLWVGIPFAKGWKVLNNEKYWKDNHKRAIETVWVYGSHPCFGGISISNESYHYATSSVGKEGQDKHGERIADIGKAVQDAFGWNFWTFADGDESLGDRLDFCSFHYLNKQGSYVYKPGTLGYYGAGVEPYAPDCWYLNAASKIPEKGTIILPHFKYGSMACADTESYWFMVNGPTICDRIGDSATISSANQFYTMRGMGWCWQSYEGFRDMEMALLISLSWESFFGTFQKNVWFGLPEQQVRYYSGSKFDRRLNLFDDSGKPGNLKFVWELVDSNGKLVKNGDIEKNGAPVCISRNNLVFDIPKVDKRTEYVLKMKIFKDGQLRKNEERIVDVWPTFKPAFKDDSWNNDTEQGVYDPKGTIAPVLAKMGWKARKINKLDEKSLDGIKRLLVGPMAADGKSTNLKKTIVDFAKRGGRVLIFRQDNNSLLPADSVYDNRGYVSKAFVRTAGHPIMKGLTDRDFNMWQPNHLLAKGIYSKPEKGNNLTLLDAGFALSLNWSLIIEFYTGKGSIVATQLMIADTFAEEPMSADITNRMLTYLNDPIYKEFNSELYVLEPVSEPVLKALNTTRANFEFVKNPPAPDKKSVLLVDLSLEKNQADLKALKNFAEAGGTLVLHRARPEHQKFLSELTAKKVDVKVQPYYSWIDRQILDRRDGLVEGLNNIDLYWRPVIKDCTGIGRNQVSMSPRKPRGQTQYLVKSEGLSEYLFPGGLSEIALGKGRVVFDQLGWELPAERKIYKAYNVVPLRALSALLNNLGIMQREPTPPISLPKGVKYEPVDISKVVNRGLKDEKGGDGIGWKDWGPAADLSSFPTGKRHFNRVPFLIPKGNKNCIVLKAAKKILPALIDYPDKVVIPVNKKNVAGFYFLHAGGWTYGSTPFAQREIVYADGAKEIIPLSILNFPDWNCGRDNFPDEKGTRTVVGWKGSTKTWPMVRVYQQLWVNPHPEKEVKEIVLTVENQPDENKRFVAHIGVTAAILPEKGAAAEKKRDSAKSQKLFSEARTLIKAGKEKEAMAKASQAIDADDKNVSAWGIIANIRSKTDSVSDFEELCDNWAAAVPTSPAPWNILARFYESKKMFPNAIKAYRRSLEIDSISQLDIYKKIEKLEKGE